MEKDFIDKLKNYFHVLPKIILFILKSAVLIFICTKVIYLFLFIAMLIAIAYGYTFKFFGLQTDTWYLTGITTQIFQITVYYFISKKLGIIKAFDKFPFWVSFVIAALYETIIMCYIVTGFEHILNSLNSPVYYIKRMIISSLQGYGYLYTFLTYTIIRFTPQLRRRLLWLKQLH